MPAIKIEGLNVLQKKLRKNKTLADVKRVIRTNGAELQNKMQRNADFKRGYQTGTTKRSVVLTMEDDGLTARVGPETEYSPYLEYGTRFMMAQPFVNPTFNEQKEKFKKDIQKLVR